MKTSAKKFKWKYEKGKFSTLQSQRSFNNISAINYRADKSIYHALGLSTFSYLEAVMTFERVRLVTLHLDILHKYKGDNENYPSV